VKKWETGPIAISSCEVEGVPDVTLGRRVGAVALGQAGIGLIVRSDPTDPTPLGKDYLYGSGAR
jgi:hypothetical protein